MGPLVMKFGGTSVADADAIRRVVAIAGAATPPALLVVSALARVTDALLQACELARLGNLAAVEASVAALRARHLEVCDRLFAGRGEGTNVRRDIDQECDDLRAVLLSVAVLREVTPRGKDRVAAAGELMSSRLIAAALGVSGVGSRWVDARSVIVTDAAHGAALPLTERTRVAAERALRQLLDAGEVPVIGGFVGATVDGVTTTLGRGGSDYSAAVIGAALDAREIQIWTDVDGMLTADPRVVADAQLVPHLSFAEASELAFFGAKVLHPSTILPAVDRHIPVRILNTMRPDGNGSVITAEPPASHGIITAIACKQNVTVVDVTSTRMLLAHGFLRRLFEVFERYNASVDVVTTSEVSVSMTLDADHSLDRIVAELSEFASVQVERGMAIVCAVGDQVRGDPARALQVISALDGVPLRMVSQAASRRNVTVVVADRDVHAAMSRLHARFFAAAGVTR